MGYYDKTFESMVQEVRDCLDGKRPEEGDPNAHITSGRSCSIRVIGEQLAVLAFALDEPKRTLRDWEYEEGEGKIFRQKFYAS